MEKGSSSSSSSPAVAASINPFKFGTKIHFGGGLHPQEEVEEAAPPRSPAKKGRMAVRCQVEGCSVDLSDSKAYYCRHKVCGVHSKSPMVIVAGLHQRFCQQCSRFHQLPEFDQGKRSCRRRLAGHNERRRKPPPSPLLSSRYTSLSPSIFDGNIRIDAYSGGLLSGHATASTRSFQLPWPQAAAAPHSLLQGSTTRSSYSIAGDCLRESSSALSLLSNEPWGSTSQASDHGDGVDSSSAPYSRYSIPSWELRGDSESGHSLVEMPSDIGSAQTSHSHSTNSPYSRNHINWSL